MVSLIGYHYPKKLIKWLVNIGYAVIECDKGIHISTRHGSIDIQIVILNMVNEKEYPWLSLIKKKLESKNSLIERLKAEIVKLGGSVAMF